MKKPLHPMPRTDDERSESFLGHFSAPYILGGQPLTPGRIYLLDRDGCRILLRLVGFEPGFRGGSFTFSYLGQDDDTGLPRTHFLVLGRNGLPETCVWRGDDLREYPMAEVTTDELPTYIDLPFKTPAFDQALRGGRS